MSTTILDHYARLHTPYLHARGRLGTHVCLRELTLLPGENVLEIGFGTGQTLVEIAARHPGVRLFGVEKSALMRSVAQKRLRFSGVRGIALAPVAEPSGLPFADAFFDKVYCESVLAILPEAGFKTLLAEIRRVLRPGGLFVCNETVWRDGVSAETIRDINRQCVEWFGIPQASAHPAYLDEWRAGFENAGFQLQKTIRLEGLRIPLKPDVHPALLRSSLFSKWGRVRALFQPAVRRWRTELHAREQAFSAYGLCLEGVVFVLNATPRVADPREHYPSRASPSL